MGYPVVKDEKGHFVKGVLQPVPRPGRPKKTQEDSILEFFLETLEQPGVRDNAKAAFAEKLSAADLKAWQLMLSYLVGLPIQRVKVEAQQSILAGILGDLRDVTPNPQTLADPSGAPEDTQTT